MSSQAPGPQGEIAKRKGNHELDSPGDEVDNARLGRAYVYNALRGHSAASSPAFHVRGDTGGLASRDRRPNWGALIALVGAMLIYGAYDPPGRPLILTVAGLSKLIFIGLVLSKGAQYLGHQAGLAVVIDLVMVALFIGYLVAVRRSQTAI